MPTLEISFCSCWRNVIEQDVNTGWRKTDLRHVTTLTSSYHTINAVWSLKLFKAALRPRLIPRRGLVIHPVCIYLISSHQSYWSWTLLPACLYCPSDWQLGSWAECPVWQLMMDRLETMLLCQMQRFSCLFALFPLLTYKGIVITDSSLSVCGLVSLTCFRLLKQRKQYMCDIFACMKVTFRRHKIHIFFVSNDE